MTKTKLSGNRAPANRSKGGDSAAVVPLNPNRDFMLADLERSGLTPDDIRVECDAKADAGFSGKAVASYRILYADLPGQETGFFRTRFDVPKDSGLDKYKQKPDANPSVALYFATPEQYEQWALAGHKLIVEGEKKAAAALKRMGLLAAGIGGCANWGSHIDDQTDHPSQYGAALLPTLAQAVRNGDRFTLVFDADIATNEAVARAANSLALELHVRGATPVIKLLPPAAKGLDDWLLTFPARTAEKEIRVEFDKLPEWNWRDWRRAMPYRRTVLHFLARTSRGAQFELKGPRGAQRWALVQDEPRAVDILEFIATGTLATEQYVGPMIDGRVYREHSDDIELLRVLCSVTKKWPREHIKNARRAILERNRMNLLGDWLHSLDWDGRPRIATMFRDLWRATAQPHDYLEDAARVVLVGAVARCLVPGTKFDFQITLVGAQGIGKTKSWSALAGRHPVHDADGHPYELCKLVQIGTGPTDVLRIAHSSWFLNFDEEDPGSRADQKAKKNTTTAQRDTWVPKYHEHAKEKKRACIFVGTTNESEILSDPTGNRRHLPVECGNLIDLEGIDRAREQLWAEAVHLYRQDVCWWIVRHAAEEQERHRKKHAWEEVFAAALDSGEACLKYPGHGAKGTVLITTGKRLLALVGVDVHRDAPRYNNALAAVISALAPKYGMRKEKAQSKFCLPGPGRNNTVENWRTWHWIPPAENARFEAFIVSITV